MILCGSLVTTRANVYLERSWSIQDQVSRFQASRKEKCRTNCLESLKPCCFCITGSLTSGRARQLQHSSQAKRSLNLPLALLFALCSSGLHVVLRRLAVTCSASAHLGKMLGAASSWMSRSSFKITKGLALLNLVVTAALACFHAFVY